MSTVCSSSPYTGGSSGLIELYISGRYDGAWAAGEREKVAEDIVPATGPTCDAMNASKEARSVSVTFAISVIATTPGCRQQQHTHNETRGPITGVSEQAHKGV